MTQVMHVGAYTASEPHAAAQKIPNPTILTHLAQVALHAAFDQALDV